jgi:hypothetical protein
VNDQENADVRNALLLAGGAALLVLGAGVIMAHPDIRRSVLASLAPLLPTLQEPTKAGVGAALPDVERYMRLRAM